MSGAEWMFNGQILGDGFYLLKNGELFRFDPKIKWPIAKTVNVITGETHYPTHADEIRAMSDEELAVWLAKFTDCGECPVWDEFPHCTTSEESCACRWHEWLKKEGEK